MKAQKIRSWMYDSGYTHNAANTLYTTYSTVV